MRLAFIILGATASLAAHGQTPPCSDTRTIELVKRIFEQAIERRAAGQPRAKDIVSGVMAKSSVTVQSIRTARIDEKSDKHFCEGVLEIQLSPRSIAYLNTPEGRALLAKGFDTRNIRIEGNKATREIRYTSQGADDGKRHFAEAGNFQGLAELAYRLTAPEIADQLKQ